MPPREPGMRVGVSLFVPLDVAASAELVEHPGAVGQLDEIEEVPLVHGAIWRTLARDHAVELAAELLHAVLGRSRADLAVFVSVLAVEILPGEGPDLTGEQPRLVHGSRGLDVLSEKRDQLATLHDANDVACEGRCG